MRWMVGTGRWLSALVRASHPEPAALVTAVATVLAVRTGRSAAGVVAVFAAVGAGQLSVGWHNDWLDAARDAAAARTDKPVASGEITVASVRAAALAALVAAAPLSLASGLAAGGVHIAAVALAWSYNARLKATPVSFLPYVLAFPLLMAFVTLGAAPARWPPAWLLGAAAALGGAAHLVNAAPDLADDEAAGIRGLPHRLGRSLCVRVTVALLVVATAVESFGPGRPGWVVVGALGVVVASIAAGLLLGRRPGSRWLFRSVLLVAATDVAELIVRGSHL